jgi:hypothetical protein
MFIWELWFYFEKLSFNITCQKMERSFAHNHRTETLSWDLTLDLSGSSPFLHAMSYYWFIHASFLCCFLCVPEDRRVQDWASHFKTIAFLREERIRLRLGSEHLQCILYHHWWLRGRLRWWSQMHSADWWGVGVQRDRMGELSENPSLPLSTPPTTCHIQNLPCVSWRLQKSLSPLWRILNLVPKFDTGCSLLESFCWSHGCCSWSLQMFVWPPNFWFFQTSFSLTDPSHITTATKLIIQKETQMALERLETIPWRNNKGFLLPYSFLYSSN